MGEIGRISLSRRAALTLPAWLDRPLATRRTSLLPVGRWPNPAVDRLALVTADEVVLVTRGPRGQAPILLAAYRARDGRVGWRVPLQTDHWPTWTPDGRLLIVGSPPDSTAPKPS
jgi:hypothetical protein